MVSFSFVIPALNEEAFIEACIYSIQTQYEAPLEIIVVDNGSNDRTMEIAINMGCIIAKEEMRGLSHARNRGAEVARGEIVCFIDADCVLSRNWTFAARQCFSKNNVGAVSGLSVYTHSNLFKRIWYNSYVVVTNGGALLSKLLFSRMVFAGNNFAIRRELFLKIGGYEPVIGEGMWLSRRFWKLKNYTGGFCPRMLLWNSPRGFEYYGFLRTFYFWVYGSVTRASQNGYTYKSR